MVGDGEAETGPLEGSWKGVRFLNPARDGAVLPILHLNGYKISGPTVLGRAPDDEVIALLARPRLRARMSSRATTRARCTTSSRRRSTRCLRRDPRDPGGERASRRQRERPLWPAIVLRTPKGWTGPKVVDGMPVEGTFRAHQVPLAGVARTRSTWRMLEEWMRSYRPEERFDEAGRLGRRSSPALAPSGRSAWAQPARQRRQAAAAARSRPTSRTTPSTVERPADARCETTRPLGELLRDVYRRQRRADFRLFCPDETNSNRLGAVFEVEDRCLMDARPDDEDHVAPRAG